MDPESLIDLVRTTHGIVLDAVRPVGGGADPRASTWRGESGAVAYAVRLTGQIDSAGPAVLDHLARCGVRGVSAPIRALHGELCTTYGDLRLSVLPWVDGATDHAARLTAEQWATLGTLLRQVHDCEPEPVRDVVPADWLDHARHDQLLLQVSHGLDHRPANPHGDELAELWQRASPRITDLQARMHDLRRILTPDWVGSVICHSDPHLGNVITPDDGTVWLIDWDDAVLAPRERDLMFVLGGVLADHPVGPVQRDQFFAGYGEIAIDPELITWFRCLRAIEDLALPAVEILRASRSAPERADDLSIVRGVLSPSGLVAQALGE